MMTYLSFIVCPGHSMVEIEGVQRGCVVCMRREAFAEAARMMYDQLGKRLDEMGRIVPGYDTALRWAGEQLEARAKGK